MVGRDPPGPVLMLPDYSVANPYQRLLAQALGDMGVTVRLGDPPRGRILPIRALARRSGARVVHLHWTDPFVVDRRRAAMTAKAMRLLIDATVLRASGIRLVWTVHNSLSHERPHPRLERVALAGLARLANAMLVHCEAARREASDTYHLGPTRRRRISVVLPGNYEGCYPPPVSRGEARAGLGLAGRERILLCFGMLRGYKGLAEFIEAFRASPPDGWTLLVAGRPLGAVAEAVTRATAGDPRVVLRLGFVHDRDVANHFAACDAVALPYRRIMLSSAAILGLTMGRPLLAPRIGCMEDMLDTGGTVWCDFSDSADVARALEDLSSRDLLAMGAHNRRVAESMQWSAVAAATASVYRGNDWGTRRESGRPDRARPT